MLKLTVKTENDEEVIKFPNNSTANLLGSSIVVMNGTEILFKAPENDVLKIIKDNSTIDTNPTDN